MPCDVIGFDFEDKMGNKIEDFYGFDHELKKHRIDENGNELSVESY